MKLLLILALLLSGCKSVTILTPGPEFPPIPESFKQRCPDLAVTPDSELLSDFIRTVTVNYSEYHKCRALVDAWQEWYNVNKQIHENLTNDRLRSK